MIEYTANFIFTLNCQIERGATAPCTQQGLEWALEFVQSLNKEKMTERELSHACRLTTFRGKVKPVYKA